MLGVMFSVVCMVCRMPTHPSLQTDPEPVAKAHHDSQTVQLAPATVYIKLGATGFSQESIPAVVSSDDPAALIPDDDGSDASPWQVNPLRAVRHGNPRAAFEGAGPATGLGREPSAETDDPTVVRLASAPAASRATGGAPVPAPSSRRRGSVLSMIADTFIGGFQLEVLPPLPELYAPPPEVREPTSGSGSSWEVARQEPANLKPVRKSPEVGTPDLKRRGSAVTRLFGFSAQGLSGHGVAGHGVAGHGVAGGADAAAATTRVRVGGAVNSGPAVPLRRRSLHQARSPGALTNPGAPKSDVIRTAGDELNWFS